MAMYRCPKTSGGAKIYGAIWAGTSSPAWTRTDDAVGLADPVPSVNGSAGSSPFDEIMPWAGMVRVQDAAVGTLVAIPKFYYKWTMDGTSMKLQISEEEFDGSFISPAHMDRGDGVGERDVIYVGAYKSSKDTYKSTSGDDIRINKKPSLCKESIHALGSDIWPEDFTVFWTIRLLYLVEYANWDCQRAIAEGTLIRVNAGATDSVPYHTGTDATNKANIGSVIYRNIEDLWSGGSEQIDGVKNVFPDAYSGTGYLYCTNNPADAEANYTNTLTRVNRTTDSGVSTGFNSSSVSGFEYVLFPTGRASDSTYSTYITDRTDINQYYSNIACGSTYRYNSDTDYRYGLFNFAGSWDTNYCNIRIMKLPN